VERGLLSVEGMISERWWLVGAFTVTLAGASISTWTTAGPRLEGTARAATRHRIPAQRDETADTLRLSAVPPLPPAPAPAPAVRARAPRREPGHISIEVLDLPEPPQESPLLWDDLFPAPARQGNGASSPATAPCFDRLQGIEGLSPCPAVTPR
jgi:hypothetical protein